jgi:hypothetical protein
LAQDVRAAGDYSLTLRAPSEVQQFENTELTAVVKDSQGQPVNGVASDIPGNAGLAEKCKIGSKPGYDQ